MLRECNDASQSPPPSSYEKYPLAADSMKVPQIKRRGRYELAIDSSDSNERCG